MDDICDGGCTFIELAKVLRPLTTGQVKLYVHQPKDQVVAAYQRRMDLQIGKGAVGVSHAA